MSRLLVGVLLLLSGCAWFEVGKTSCVSVSSPDGRNEIRLLSNPLSYEVYRDGVKLVSRSRIGLTVDGVELGALADLSVAQVTREKLSGCVPAAVYKKGEVDLEGCSAEVNFGEWSIRLVSRNDGVAYRFETRKTGKIRINQERASIVIPDASAKCCLQKTSAFGEEEHIPEVLEASRINLKAGEMIYLPFVYSVGGKAVAVTESDVVNYPIWNLSAPMQEGNSISFESIFAGQPQETYRVGGWHGERVEKGGRWIRVGKHADFLSETAGVMNFPWRTFVLADSPNKFCEADIVWALARPQGANFSWVKPGKVIWDWWNCFDNQGDEGCNTKTYERFIDFAAQRGVEYVILDEGWSDTLNIWKYSPRVDVPHIVNYANERGVGIILWMAWAQVYGEEEKVAKYFSKLGVKGFKVDFIDRGDAEAVNFVERFAAACAKEHMVLDYHGMYRPVGLSRTYPNVLNYEGIHGLEQMKWFEGGETAACEMMKNDVMAFYLRLTAGPMDYTPGAMLNYALNSKYRGDAQRPGSVGTRCHQMAMMVLYEAPLQMLCDSPTNYEQNMESFSFMVKIPVVWNRVLGLAGTPEDMIVAARQSHDGSWYVAGLVSDTNRDFTLDTSFLGAGDWKVEFFQDAADANASPEHYEHISNKSVKNGETLNFRMARGGGFVAKFTK